MYIHEKRDETGVEYFFLERCAFFDLILLHKVLLLYATNSSTHLHTTYCKYVTVTPSFYLQIMYITCNFTNFTCVLAPLVQCCYIYSYLIYTCDSGVIMQFMVITPLFVTNVICANLLNK